NLMRGRRCVLESMTGHVTSPLGHRQWWRRPVLTSPPRRNHSHTNGPVRQEPYGAHVIDARATHKRACQLSDRLLSERFSSTTGKLAKHVLQDAAVAVVVGLTGGVDADHTVEVDGGAVVLRRRDLDGRRGRPLVELRDTLDGEGLGAVESQRLSRFAGGELQRQD